MSNVNKFYYHFRKGCLYLPWFFIGYWILNEAGFLSSLFLYIYEQANGLLRLQKVKAITAKQVKYAIDLLSFNYTFVPEVD
jgi:hypothetical protein